MSQPQDAPDTLDPFAVRKPPLEWSRRDLEQRCGFSGGRFTRTNNVFTGILGVLLAVGVYAAIMPFGDAWIHDTLTLRGPTPYAIVLLSCWSLSILLVKWWKLRLQRRALDFQVMPDEPGFVLSANTVDSVLAKVYETVDEPRNFILFNRVVVALSNLRNLGRVTDVDEILRSQAAQDESTLETSYSLVQGFVWAIPVLGFIGTVLGLSEAIGQFSGVLGASADVEQISGALKGVTAGLATAFETTLQALVAALVIQLLITFLRKEEEEFLDQSMDYCLRSVVGRLRILTESSVEV